MFYIDFKPGIIKTWSSLFTIEIELFAVLPATR